MRFGLKTLEDDQLCAKFLARANVYRMDWNSVK